MSYWTEEVHPAQLPMSAREAWHRDAWDREQTELVRVTQGAAYDPPAFVVSTGGSHDSVHKVIYGV